MVLCQQHYNIGAGRQGTAAAYDLGKWGDAANVVMVGHNGDTALHSANRINNLLGRDIATGVPLDVQDHAAVVESLKPVDVCICGTPFIYILPCTEATLEAGTNMVDFGGHTDTVLK
jgi:lysine 6-dehydrogenase